MQELKIETKIGTLVAVARPDPYYPGFDLGLERPDGSTYWFALAEVNQNDDDGPVQLALHQWSPDGANCDDPIYDSYYTPAEIDAGLRGE